MFKRREFTASLTALATAPLWGQDPGFSPRTRAKPPAVRGRKPLAVICSTYYPLSHAYHIAGRFLHGYYLDGKHHLPDHYIHSLYTHQIPENDVSRDLAKTFGFKIAKNIPEAIVDGNGNLDVDGVLLIVEHGDYPVNKLGQILYPRYEFMEEVVGVFKKTGKTVPVFCDKHLSITWDKAAQMVRWSKELGFPLMAGSSLPFVWRKPSLELPLQTPIKEALVAAYSRIEIYGLHSLEVLQTMLERRKGGETGVKSVQCLRGDAVWRAGDAGRWSWKLLDAALSRSETLNPGDIRVNTGGVKSLTIPQMGPIAFLIEYRDGTKGTVLLLNGHIQDFCFAAQAEGKPEPYSCLFQLPLPPGAKFFDAQVSNLEKLFTQKKSPVPPERTLLTTGILARALESDFKKQVLLETPEMDVRYQAPLDSGFLRGPISASPDK